MKHIQQETRCRVQIKGRGSGFMEHGTGQESDEPMYLHVAGPDPAEVQKAKELCLDLLENVRGQYEEFKNRAPPQRGYGSQPSYGEQSGGGRGYGDRGNDRSNSNSYGGGGGGYGGYNNSPAPTNQGLMSPATPSAPGAGSPTAGADYAAQYAAYYGAGADPYAAYGGYAAYVQYYQQYMAAAQAAAGQQQSPPPGAPGASSAPPPPPSEAPPPPPPSNGPPGAGGYNAVSLTSKLWCSHG